jgi:hypothetical protein
MAALNQGRPAEATGFVDSAFGAAVCTGVEAVAAAAGLDGMAAGSTEGLDCISGSPTVIVVALVVVAAAARGVLLVLEDGLRFTLGLLLAEASPSALLLCLGLLFRGGFSGLTGFGGFGGLAEVEEGDDAFFLRRDWS